MLDQISQTNTNPDWFDNLLTVAIQSRASDIHIEPQREEVSVRLRIDGLLHKVGTIGNETKDNIISKIKVMSSLDITERRVAQDGHFEIKYNNRIYNFRVSTLPTMYGETVVARIFNREDIFLNIETLGFLPDQLKLVQRIISKSTGIVLVTGPTGSGKTNLLYSILNAINKTDQSILTLEDPIEYELANIRQTAINDEIGLTYAKAMRAVTRQDPDVVMVGEIRDSETADNAIQAALTGISIFSSFHTFDVPALVTRFFEFHITPSIVAQVIEGVISTRLLRKICDSCKTQYQPQTDEIQKMQEYIQTLPVPIAIPQMLYKGTGCNKCNKTGYFDRTGIYEIVYFDDEIAATIIDRKSVAELTKLLRQKEIKTLRQVAFEKIVQGITTFDEVLRVLGQVSSIEYRQ